MKNAFKQLAIIALGAVIGFSMAACDTEPEEGDPDNVPGGTLAAQLAWLGSNAKSDTAYVLTASANEDIQTFTMNGANFNGRSRVTVTLKGTGGVRTIGTAGSGGLFNIENGFTLIADENIKLTHGSGNNDRLIDVRAGGTFVMNNGSSISGATFGGVWGTAVFVATGGTFTMNGGSISDNTGTYGFGYGSTVSVYGGTFTMNGGDITNNTTAAGGAGVHISEGGTFTMNGGTLSDNRTSGGGGGVFISRVNSNAGTFTMNGGTISGNTADDGGGVSVDGNFTMKGGVISGNTASLGGAVFISRYGNFNKTAEGGIIYGNNEGGNSNTATSNGHVAYIYGGTYTTPQGIRNTTVAANEQLTAANGATGQGTWGD